MVNPKCPYCGEEMELYSGKELHYYHCRNCGSQAPIYTKQGRGYLCFTPEEAYAAAMKRYRAKGEWITRTDKRGNTWYYCSECGHEMFFTGTFDSEQHFCYYCGADMRKEENDER